MDDGRGSESSNGRGQAPYAEEPSAPAAATAGRKPMREAMPNVAEFVDAMRAIFGKEEVDGAIRAGMAGEPRFYAEENGHRIGTPLEAGIFLDSDETQAQAGTEDDGEPTEAAPQARDG